MRDEILKPLKARLDREQTSDGSIFIAIMLGIGAVVCMFMV